MGKFTNRRRTEERIQQTSDDKEKMLIKSKYRCAKCGKIIPNHLSMTVEHVIPLSKGGTNDEVNKVALCCDCNTAKGNLIAHPDLYKYLHKQAQNELKEYTEQYLQKYNYLTLNTLTPFDMFEVPYAMILSNKIVSNKMLVKKAVDNKFGSDFQRIKDFVMEYHKKYQIGQVTDSNEKPLDTQVADIIQEYFAEGEIFYVEQNGEIKLALFVSIKEIDLAGKQHYAVVFNNPIAANDSYTYSTLIHSIVKYILDVLGNVCAQQKIGMLPYAMILFQEAQLNNKLILRDLFNMDGFRTMQEDRFQGLKNIMVIDDHGMDHTTYPSATLPEDFLPFDRLVARIKRSDCKIDTYFRDIQTEEAEAVNGYNGKVYNRKTHRKRRKYHN